MPTTHQKLVYIDLVNEEDKSVLLLAVPAKDIREATKLVEKKYPDRKIIEIREGTRLLM